MKTRFEDSYLGQLRKLVGSRLLIMPGVRLVIEDADGRVLLLKRSDDGMWGLPAGTPEAGESIEDCARRELDEETSLKLKSFECFGHASNPETEVHTYPNGHKVHSFALLLYSRDWEGAPSVNDDEATEVRFFAPSELPPRAEILQHELASLELYRNYRATGRFQWA